MTVVIRGGGFISLENLLFFAKTFPVNLLLNTFYLENIHNTLNVTSRFHWCVDFVSASFKETRRWKSGLGISIRCCWCQHYLHDHANARPRSLWESSTLSLLMYCLRLWSKTYCLLNLHVQQSLGLLYGRYSYKCYQVRHGNIYIRQVFLPCSLDTWLLTKFLENVRKRMGLWFALLRCLCGNG